MGPIPVSCARLHPGDAVAPVLESWAHCASRRYRIHPAVAVNDAGYHRDAWGFGLEVQVPIIAGQVTLTCLACTGSVVAHAWSCCLQLDRFPAAAASNTQSALWTGGGTPRCLASLGCMAPRQLFRFWVITLQPRHIKPECLASPWAAWRVGSVAECRQTRPQTIVARAIGNWRARYESGRNVSPVVSGDSPRHGDDAGDKQRVWKLRLERLQSNR